MVDGEWADTRLEMEKEMLGGENWWAGVKKVVAHSTGSSGFGLPTHI